MFGHAGRDDGAVRRDLGCARLGSLLKQRADRGDPLLPGGRPLTLPLPSGRTVPPGEAAAAAADGDRAALERLAVLNREQIEIAARHDVLSTALAVARERWATARLMAAGLAQ